MGLTAICLMLFLVPGRAETIVLDRASADAAAVARFRAGDEQAFEELVARGEAEIYRLSLRFLGNREDALDVAQESLLKAYRKIFAWQPTGGFLPWLLRLTISKSNLHLRLSLHCPRHRRLSDRQL